jgi:RNA polymerase sigma-70 factor, ECF subfamily
VFDPHACNKRRPGIDIPAAPPMTQTSGLRMPDWSAIVDECSPLVWRTVYRILGNHADAADCFQRTFVSAVGVVEPVRNWPGLLRRLATARALEQLRQRVGAAGRVVRLGDAPPADGRAGDPPDLAGAEELAARLRDALAEIDPVQAAVFCLVRLDDLSYRDAGAQLGITVNHAGVLLNRARAALRDRLRDFDPNSEPRPGRPS